ncbi:hypothetical protein HAZT_HAZT003062 [Hyalella azteca]|uniref:Uncharacterized protein n=1 Tax=Hyalella azteca TaxID=294128 RepID=A0A6A0H4S8_HYAAZ|nr:hypothetical protein HAZT_HAZT003062 [Hyalella azteca]
MGPGLSRRLPPARRGINEIIDVDARTDSRDEDKTEPTYFIGVVQFIDDVTVDDLLFGFGVWRTEPVKFHLKPRFDPVKLHFARRVAVPSRPLLRPSLIECKGKV